MILLLDIGNSRVKWAKLREGVLEAQSAMSHSGAQRASAIDAVLAMNEQPQRVLISNVAGEVVGNAFSAAITSAWAVMPEFVHSTAQAAGVTNAYREPEKLGVDRWLGVIAAHAMNRGAACVVAVGTAMTIDGVDGTGRHLGGVIVPGPDLMIESLLQNTSEIAKRATAGSVGLGMFANNTLGAIRQGSAHALAALVERAVADLRQTLGVTPSLLLTGGASDQVSLLLREQCEIVPDLVLRGLAVLGKAD